MNQLYNTPGDFDKSDPKNLRTHRIFADKHSQIVEYRNVQFLSTMLMRLHLCQLFEELAEEFLGKRKPTQSLLETSLIKILHTFCKHLQLLMEHNLSQDVKFVANLSYLWHGILHHINECDLLMQPPKHVQSLKTVMKQIFQFPKKSDHSFGYYLNEYAGEKWLPFPFMDLLNQLHEEALLKKERSTLGDWCRSLILVLHPLENQ